MTDAQNGSGEDTEGDGSNPEVARMWQKLYQMPGGKKDPFEDTVAHLPNGLVRAGTSPDTGRPMYTTPADAPLTYTFNEAAEYARQLNVQKYLGHDDWRVPTKGELNELFRNRAAIGGFNETGSNRTGWYRSSTLRAEANEYGWEQRFSRDGSQGISLTSSDRSLALRCVRG